MNEKLKQDEVINEMIKAAGSPTMAALIDKVFRPYHVYLHDSVIPRCIISQNVTEPCQALTNMIGLMIITMTEAGSRGDPTYEGTLYFYNRFQHEINKLLRRKIEADFGVATMSIPSVGETEH